MRSPSTSIPRLAALSKQPLLLQSSTRWEHHATSTRGGAAPGRWMRTTSGSLIAASVPRMCATSWASIASSSAPLAYISWAYAPEQWLHYIDTISTPTCTGDSRSGGDHGAGTTHILRFNPISSFSHASIQSRTAVKQSQCRPLFCLQSSTHWR